MSLALKHRDRTLALQSASAPASGGGLTPSSARRTSIDPAAGQIKLRLRHDAQRLKQIKATSAKILAKRDMLPEYRAWCDGLLEAGRAAGWKINTDDGIQRYKGLGEMNAKELWETTMDPAVRVLRQVTLDDAAAADELFSVLMGEDVAARRSFIARNAKDVRFLDV